MTSLTIALLGPLQIQLDGQPVTLPYDKVRALLAYLALESTRPLRRDTLTALLWPAQSDKEARHNLSQALLKLRQALDPNDTLLLSDRHTVQLNPTADVEVDVTLFESHLLNCQSHPHARPEICDVCMDAREAAVELYQGDFLAGISIPNAPEFEDWLVIWRERLHRRVIDALDALTAYHERRGEVTAALDKARKQIRLDPWREETHRQLMCLLLYSGQRSAALAQYHRCVQILEDELGVPPAPETEALFQLIQRADAQPPHKLPPQATPFLGRQSELADLAGFLADPDCRVLTLVGPGGIGKTRLALAAAERQLRRPTQQPDDDASNVGFFTDGVYWISLMGVETAAGLVPTIANALGLQLESGGPANSGRSAQQQLLDYLREKRLLLLLDNFEQLLTTEEANAATAVLRGILQEAPHVQLLVTSRERMQLREEQLYQLHGLDYPKVEIETENQDELDLTGYSSVALFTQIAQLVRPDFQCHGSTAHTVAHICRTLHGMPLAIELAATLTNVLSPAEISAELQHNFDLLATTTRHVPTRHRSLRAAFASSWRRLTDDEQAVFAKLSIFRGGFTRAAAQAVAETSLPVLSALANKSFVRFHPETERYEIHELMRQFGAEMLNQSQTQADHTAHLHSAYFAEKLEQWTQASKGARQQSAFLAMTLDGENIRTAWHWAVTHGRTDLLAQAIDGPGFLYQWQGRYQEVLAMYQSAVQRLRTATGSTQHLHNALVKARTWQGLLTHRLGQTETAIALLETTLHEDSAVNSALGPPSSQYAAHAFLLHTLGDTLLGSAMRDQAKVYLEKSLALYESLADQWGMGQVYVSLGILMRELGDYPMAIELTEKGLAVTKAIGASSLIADCLGRLGLIAMDMGELARAETFMLEQLALYQELNFPLGVATSLDILGLLHLFRGEFNAAQNKFEERLAILHHLGVKQPIGLTYIWLGIAQFNQGLYEEAYLYATRSLSLVEGAGSLWEIGHAKMLLGYTQLARGALDEARSHITSSIALFQQLDQRDELSQAWAWMAYIELAQGQFAAAQTALITCLRMALAVRTILPLMEALPAIVKLLVVQEEPILAVEIHTMAMQIPGLKNSCAFVDLVGEPGTVVAEALPPEVAAAAQERGRQRELWTTAAELLAYFETAASRRDS
ncbi:MAG: AAA family ATPase [Caldilineaceae bacterium]|nr:AAA family ATPase [Caldilineaceae bacterium]